MTDKGYSLEELQNMSREECIELSVKIGKQLGFQEYTIKKLQEEGSAYLLMNFKKCNKVGMENTINYE